MFSRCNGGCLCEDHPDSAGGRGAAVDLPLAFAFDAERATMKLFRQVMSSDLSWWIKAWYVAVLLVSPVLALGWVALLARAAERWARSESLLALVWLVVLALLPALAVRSYYQSD